MPSDPLQQLAGGVGGWAEKAEARPQSHDLAPFPGMNSGRSWGPSPGKV